MANCNCNDFPIACAPHAPGGDCCHHPHGCPPHPCPPPNYKGGTSMYIGARYVPIFADPVEWDDVREYEPLTIVTHNGDCYTSKCYVPKGAQLPPYPEGQTKYWVKTSDYNYQFADLKKTVTDLSRLVEQFQKDNERFTELINGWNAQVQQWEKDMTAWGERLDTVESNVSTLTDSLNAEIARAKAAEQANAAAITEETALREAGDTANKNLIKQEQNRAEGEETAIREEFAAADTALSNRITANKADINAIKAEQAIQNTNISNNAKNISDNSAEIAKHAKRLTSLESNASDWDTIFPDTTIAQEMNKEQTARANADTALNGRCDAIAADVEEVRDIANHKVDQTTFQKADVLNVKYANLDKRSVYLPSLAAAAEPKRTEMSERHILVNLSTTAKANYGFVPASFFALKSEVDTAQTTADTANATIGDWETDHPNQTISECATSIENEVAAVDAKADANAANIGNWNTEHPGKTISQAVTDLQSSTGYTPAPLTSFSGGVQVGFALQSMYDDKSVVQLLSAFGPFLDVEKITDIKLLDAPVSARLYFLNPDTNTVHLVESPCTAKVANYHRETLVLVTNIKFADTTAFDAYSAKNLIDIQLQPSSGLPLRRLSISHS